MPSVNRRNFLAAAALGLPLIGSAGGAVDGPRHLVVVGGHPDDPETGCGGLIALATRAGHRVTVLYLTRGEAGIHGRTHEEAAAIRTEEARQACDILGCDHRFLGQIDGDTYVNRAAYEQASAVLNELSPDLLLTHWPVDTHRDHRVAAQLAYDAWLSMDDRPDLYYYEVVHGHQTQNFVPTHFVDITAVRETKHAACFAHRSQKIEEVYMADHGAMERWRGVQSGHEFAEAYVAHWRTAAVVGV